MPLVEPDEEPPVEPDVPGLVGVLELLPEGLVDNGVSTVVRGAELEPEDESDDDEPLEPGEVELLPEDG